MRTIRKLSFIVILGVVICALIMLGSSSLNAIVAGKADRPDSPPGKPDIPGEEATWAVRIPTSGLMLYGMTDINGYYENNDTNIKVSVEKDSPGAWRRYYNFVYAFDFTLVNENIGTGNPPDYCVGFHGVGDLYGNLYDVTYPEESLGKPCCQFPGDSCVEIGCLSPDCPAHSMAKFLNNTHPYSDGIEANDYQFFWTRVSVFDKDIELMAIGETYVFGSASDPGEPGDYFKMVARYRQECYPEPAYHDVEIARNINRWRASELGNPLNIVIERLDETAYEIECDGVWRIRVLPEDYFSTAEGFLCVKERYCTEERNKTTWYYPLEAKGRFDFYIDWIKNPTTQ